MAKLGRPAKGEYAEKKEVFASRIRRDTLQKLRQAAAKSGRSVSQEFEHQLRRGLDEDDSIESGFGDVRTYAIMKLAAQAANSVGKLKNLKVHWTANAELFDEVLEVITRTLKVFRPHQLTAVNLVVGPPQLGTPTLEIVREVHKADPARPLDKSTKRHRAMARMKDQLGELADRAAGQLPEDAAGVQPAPTDKERKT